MYGLNKGCINKSLFYPGCFLFLVRGIFTENHKIRDWWQESQYSDEMDTTDKNRPIIRVSRTSPRIEQSVPNLVPHAILGIDCGIAVTIWPLELKYFQYLKRKKIHFISFM